MLPCVGRPGFEESRGRRMGRRVLLIAHRPSQPNLNQDGGGGSDLAQVRCEKELLLCVYTCREVTGQG